MATEFVAGVDLRTLVERSIAAEGTPPYAFGAFVALEVAKAIEEGDSGEWAIVS